MTCIVIAHRGDSAHAPENTMAAFRQAIAKGADWIETDLQLAADQRVVAFHDDTLTRLTGERGRPRDRSAAELARLPVLATRHGDHPDQRICTLAQILAGPGLAVPFYLELKSNGRGRNDPDNVRLLAAVLAAVPNATPHALASFDLDLVRGALEAGRRGVHIVNSPREVDEAVLGQLLAVSVRHNRLNDDLLARCRRAGTAVWVWTVDRPRDIHRHLDQGVAGICTNDVAVARAAVAERT